MQSFLQLCQCIIAHCAFSAIALIYDAIQTLLKM